MKPSPMTTIRCSDSILENFLDGSMSNEEGVQMESHLESCAHCQARVQELAMSSDEWVEWKDCLREYMVDEDSRTPHFQSNWNASESILPYLAPSDDPEMLGRLADYEIQGIIGAGGMGVVLKGWDRSLNRYAAIKLLAPHLATSGAAKRRFMREARAAAAVVHENVVAIHGVAELRGLPYLVMPYARGTTLQKRIQANGPLRLEEVLRIALQVARGLAAAHAQGLVHRDVKPANILLDEGVERVLLTDFGLARAVDDASMTRTGVLAGTPQYMSPEQARAENVDARSDLFALGSVMYAMCTGRPPFRAESSYAILRLVTDQEPKPIQELNSDMPGWIGEVVSKLMAKEPCNRYASAAEIAQLLEESLAHVQQPTLSPLPVTLQRNPTQDVSRGEPLVSGRERRMALMMTLGAVALIAALVSWPVVGSLLERRLLGKSGNRTEGNANVREALEPSAAAAILSMNSTKPTIVWEKQLGKGVGFQAEPIIDGGTIYLASSNGSVFAMELASGAIQWESKLETSFKARIALRGDHLFIGDTDGGFHALRRSDGKVVWSFHANSTIHSSASFFNNLVLFTAEEGILFGLDVDSGKMELNVAIGDQLRATPLVHGRLGIFGGCDGKLHIIDLTNGGNFVGPIPLDGPTGSTAVVANGLILIPTHSGSIHFVSIPDGKKRWDYRVNGPGMEFHNSVAVSGEMVVASSRNRRAVGLDLETGKMKWETTLRKPSDSTPVIVGDQVLLTENGGRLVSLDLATGQERWGMQVADRIAASVAVEGDSLVTVSETGGVYCLQGRFRLDQ